VSTYLGGHDALALGDEAAAGAAAVAVAAVTLVTLEPRDEAVVAAACTLRPASTALHARVDRPRLAGTQWRINHDANDAMAWGPPLKGAPRAAV